MKKLTPITPRQKETLEIIIRLTKENSYPPTIPEIKDELGVKSTFAVRTHVLELIRKGYLEREPGQVRAMKVLKVPT